MSSVRFSSVDLEYGCHDRSIKLPIKQGPVVVAARNGCGKTTLIEALVRAVFGFDKSSSDDRSLLECRRPWAGNGMSLGVELVDDDWGTWRIDRDFAKSALAITNPAGETKSWSDEGEDALNILSHQQIREEITALFGSDDRRLYENTSCVRQDDLPGQRLTHDLLHVARTTYSHAESARLRLAAEARSFQIGDPAGDEEPGTEQRTIGELEARIAELEASLSQAGEIDSRRRSVARRIEGLEDELAKVENGIEMLEQECESLLSQVAEEVEIEQSQEQLSELESVAIDLERVIADREASKKDTEPVLDTSHELPEDFKERAERIEELWRARKRQRMAISKTREDLQGTAAPPLALIVVATILVLAGLPIWQAGYGAVALALCLVGLGAIPVVLFRRRSVAGDRARLEVEVEELEGELEETKAELSELVAGIPDGENLRRDRLMELVEEFEGPAQEQSPAHETSGEVEAVATIAIGVLAKWSEAPIPTQPEELLLPVERAIVSARDELVRLRGNQSSPHPASRLEALEITLEERRRARDELLADLSAARRDVEEEGRLAQSPIAARRQLDLSRMQLEEVRDRQAVLQRASELVDDAYDEYRKNDEQRLIDSLSHALASLTSSELGPFVFDEGLDHPTIKVDQREMPLECPPLGYGEYHAAMLAICIGGSGFLSNLGIRPPLILDEPFAHLDESRCVQLWRILNRIARDRQVIVATYNHLLLDQIGVTPDVVLDQAPAHPLFAAC
jgi:recombinational DNA repair ATPase RecF